MHRAARLLALPLLLAGCASGPVRSDGPDAPPDRTIHRYDIDHAPDAVWFAMRRALREMRIPLEQAEPGADYGRLVSRPFRISPGDVRCQARPSGERPLLRTPQAQLHVQLRERGGARTEAIMELVVLGASVEPDRRPAAERCISRGTLEERVLRRTRSRLVS